LFISFGGRGRVKAIQVRDRLRAEGYEAFLLDIDPADGIPAGRRWNVSCTFGVGSRWRGAARALHRGAGVAEVADRLGWSFTRLLRRFADQVGLTPKRFARVRRFQRLLASITSTAPPGAVDWAQRAVDIGYHDQAHMIHEFRALAGLCPTKYAPRSPGERNHVPLPG
jgi:AraC-like DNA-binding protein